MGKRPIVKKSAAVVVALGAFAGALLTTSTASATEEIKLGTLAPKDSAWGKVFGAWAKAVEEESGGGVKLSWYFNGTLGDEADMVTKMQSNQTDGGAFTATGLAKIYPHIVALQMPGLFPTWAKLDAVREKTKPHFEKAFADAGVQLLGSGDVGIAHLMSRGREVRVPDDLKSMHPFYISGDPIGQKFLETVGVASPKPLSVPAILPSISSKGADAVDVLNSPSIAAEQLQWAPHLDYITTMPSGIGIGALVMRKARFDALPPDAKAVLERTGKNTGKLLTERIRAMDEAAFNRLKDSKKKVELTDAEKAKWNEVFAKVRESLKREGKIKADVFDQVVAAAQ